MGPGVGVDVRAGWDAEPSSDLDELGESASVQRLESSALSHGQGVGHGEAAEVANGLSPSVEVGLDRLRPRRVKGLRAGLKGPAGIGAQASAVGVVGHRPRLDEPDGEAHGQPVSVDDGEHRVLVLERERGQCQCEARPDTARGKRQLGGAAEAGGE